MNSVVRSCCGTLERMFPGFEGGFAGITHGTNETQHRHRVDSEITQPLNQTFGRSIDFHHALNEFSFAPSNDESVRAGQS